MNTPFYDPQKSYEENFKEGPFGAFADGKILEKEGEPQMEFFGHKVYLPFGIPAGPLLNGNFAKAALDKGFDIVVYKTVRSERLASHPWPNVLPVDIAGDLTLEIAKGKLKVKNNYEDPLSITNSFGVPSASPEFWQKDIKELLEYTKKGQVVVGAFQGTKKENGNFEAYLADFVLCAKLLKDVGVKIFEVNLSCPNEGTSNLLCYDTERSAKVAEAIKKEIGNLPLIIKIGYFENDIKLREFVKVLGSIVDGISAINTISAEIVNDKGEPSLPGEGRIRSGVCGRSIKWAGIDMVGRLKKLREEFGYKYIIIGVGGVFTSDDFVEYRKVGADVVMSATGAIWNPYLAKEIKEGPLKLNIKQ